MKNSVQKERWDWFLLAAAGVVLFGLGVVGFDRYASLHNQPSTFLDALYQALQLLAMNSGAVPPPLPWELEVARFGIPLLTALAAIKAVLDLFQEQLRRLRLRTLQNHVVICGLSRKGYLLAGRLHAEGRVVVVIERDEENGRLGTCQMLGMYVLTGDATDPELLRKAGVARAAAVVAVCDDDGTNLEIALRAKPLAEKRQEIPLNCLVHIGEPQLCSLIREKETHLDSKSFQLELFNTFEHGARLLLSSFPAWEENGPASQPAVHLLVIGLGRLGENLVVHAAREIGRAHL
jgi:voltage-gated potassium channel Kch